MDHCIGKIQQPWARYLPVLFFLAFHSSVATAQTSSVSRAADTSSPRATLQSFIDGCNDVYQMILAQKYLDSNLPEHSRITQRLIDCVNVSEIPAFARDHRATEIAICIKEILDREEIPPWDDIPDEAAIEANGGVEKVPTYRIPGTRITIARVEEGPQKHEYLFSVGTVSRAVSNFQNIRTEPYRTTGPAISQGFYEWYVSVPGNRRIGAVVQWLPERLKKGTTFGMANWKWISVLATLLLGIAGMAIAYRLELKLSSRYRGTSVIKYCLTLVFPVIATVIPLAVKNFVEQYLTVRGSPLYFLSFFSNLVAILAGIVVIFAFANRVAESIIATPRINPLGLNAQLIRISAKLGSFVATVFLFICGGHFLGIPVGTLFASAGIFGAAIALAAQDTLKNLLGTIVLFADKPFRVGERIKVGSYDGVVEDIGLRSTRIRLLNGHLVTLPNSHLTATDIENVSSREHIRRDGEIYIPLDTPSEKIEKAVSIVRENLADHEGMDPARPPRVYFDEIDSAAFKIGFVFWYSPPNFWDFRAFGEKLNFAIFHEFEKHGIQFSLPFRHTFWKFDDEQGPVDVRILKNGEDPHAS